MRLVFGSALLALTMTAGSAAAQAPAGTATNGDWQGQITVRKDSLPIVLHLGAQVTGDSPAERMFGVPGKLEQTGDRLKVTLQSGGVFDGALTKGGKLEGTYSQGAVEVPLVLERQLSAPAKP